MKRIFKKIVPILLSMFIVIGVVFSGYDTAKATGMEEYLYVTYWDLMNTLYSMCGYDMTVDENVVKNHSVTGKQVWNNFTTFVENAAKIHWKAFSEAGSAAVKELKDLANTATEKGISISQDLYDMLKDVFGYQVSGEQFANVTQSDLLCFLHATSDYRILSSVSTALDNFNYYLGQGYKLNVVKDLDGYFLFVSDPACSLQYVQDTSYAYSVFKCYATKDNRTRELSASRIYSNTKDKSIGVAQTVRATEPVWVIKEGLYVVNDTISAQVSAGACPAEVPDVKPWIKSPDIPDEFRIVKPGEAPGQKPDPDEHPDWLPGIIPFKPKTPQKPDGTEETETTEKPEDPKDPEKPKPDKDKDKDKKKKPAWNPIINPQTGNVIDPETGLDIDPETGKLIDPKTGKLIDPDDAGSGGGGGGGIADKLGKYGDITKLFPFCIPFDIVNLIKGMSAEKAPPVFHFKYYFKSINYTFKVDVDLSKYAKYIKLFRYGMQIFYILALMFMTIRISKLFS